MRLAHPTAARPTARRGATLPEFALVLPVLLMFLFGIVEYARYLTMMQIVNNAARDAARWAVVRSSSPEGGVSSKDETYRYPFETPLLGPPPMFTPNPPMYTVPFVTARLLTQTVGVENNLSGMYVRVYVTDSTKLYSDPCVIAAKPNTTTWNQGGFSERLAVQVVGQYKPLLPVLGLGTSIDVNIIALMGIEG